MSLSDPSQQLPVEMISRIFAFSINFIDKPVKPLTLGAVCQSWRTIAWSSPELWTKLVIICDDLKRGNCQSIEVACQWLARSGSLPLLVWIEGPRDNNLPMDFSLLLDLLGKNVERCHTLTLDGFKFNDFARLFNAKIDNRPHSILKVLKLAISNGRSPIEPRRNELEPYLLDLSCHRLSRLHLGGIFPSQLRSNWSELTSASLLFRADEPYLVPEELMDFLEAAPRLIDCWVQKLGSYGDRSSPRFHSSHRLVLQHLQRLNIETSYHYSTAVENLFAAITLPSLQSLYVDSRDYIHFPVNTMISFIERSGCRLRTLRAQFLLNSENEEDFNRFLQANSHIATLDLTSVTDCFFNRLAIKPEDSGNDMPFLPSLGEFNYSGPRMFSWQAFEQSLWRIEASIGKGPHAPLGGPFYMSLSSEIEILSESLTRRVATLRKTDDLLFDIYSQDGQGSRIPASLRHWGINTGEDLETSRPSRME